MEVPESDLELSAEAAGSAGSDSVLLALAAGGRSGEAECAAYPLHIDIMPLPSGGAA